MTTSSRDELRLFYALWPDDAVRTGLMAVQGNMRGRLSPYENLHVTLAFLGPQAAQRVPLLTDILTHLPAVPIPLTLDRLGYFPRKKIAWIGMHAVPQDLLALRHALVDALVQEKIWLEGESAFQPHVTLARDAELPPDVVFTPVNWLADRIVLVQSITHAQGPEYRILASRTLGENAPACDPDASA